MQVGATNGKAAFCGRRLLIERIASRRLKSVTKATVRLVRHRFSDGRRRAAAKECLYDFAYCWPGERECSEDTRFRAPYPCRGRRRSACKTGQASEKLRNRHGRQRPGGRADLVCNRPAAVECCLPLMKRRSQAGDEAVGECPHMHKHPLSLVPNSVLS
jgi:hypothetical protein